MSADIQTGNCITMRTRQPGGNLVVIMSDEHNPSYMGCMGHPFMRTPHLDRLAARGTLFTDAYTPSPICVPARAAFATGKHVFQTRHWDNASPYYGEPASWGHALQQAGVRVESIGKLHYRSESDPVGFDREHLPMHVVGGRGMVWASIRDPILPFGEGKRMLGEHIGPGESSYTQYDRGVTAKALDWLQAAAADERPFVLFIGLVAPHFPLTAPERFYGLYESVQVPPVKLDPRAGAPARHPWVETYAQFLPNEEKFSGPEERRRAFLAYYALCSFLDDHVGQIVDALDRTGLSARTHILYTSDHGDNVGARGLWGKSTLYQETVKVPMILAGPRVQPHRSAVPVDLLDLYPTILEAVGVDPAPHMAERSGCSLFQVEAQPDAAERVIFSEYHATGSNTAGFMVRKGRWKYHHYVRHAPELFDLQQDPEELNDLAGQATHADVRAAMERLLRSICDPEAVDAMAKQDQSAMIERLGGRDVAATMGVRGATPAPKV